MPLKPAGISSKRRAHEASPSPPKWPPLLPLVPQADLTLEDLLEGQISIVRNFFTSELCRKYVSFLSSLPLETTPAQPKKGNALRYGNPKILKMYKSCRPLPTLLIDQHAS